MAELFEHLDQLRTSPGKVAVATLVNTRGTTPRKEGAKMVVGEGGAVLGSVTIGGCVDAQVIEESTHVLETMRRRTAVRVVHHDLERPVARDRLVDTARHRVATRDVGDDEEAWEIGLTCGGTIEVFLEPVRPDEAGPGVGRLYERVRALSATGRRGAVITRLDGDGAKLLVLDDGTTEGSLGEALLDQRFAAEARVALDQGTSRTLMLEDVRAFVEVFAPPALLLVVGASHVAMPLVSLAKILGYRTVVIDGRPRFATRERFPDVDELKIGVPSELVREYTLTPATALVLVAHDYKYDLPILREALATDVGYVGMLGSTRRGAAILKLLQEEGVADIQLKRVRVPIGLDLGARSAPEIALAVLAEIQAVRGGGSGQPMSARR